MPVVSILSAWPPLYRDFHDLSSAQPPRPFGPLVVHEFFGRNPQRSVNPDEAVAIGAAIQAGIYQGDISKLYVMDSFQASLMRAMAVRKLGRAAEDGEAAD